MLDGCCAKSAPHSNRKWHYPDFRQYAKLFLTYDRQPKKHAELFHILCSSCVIANAVADRL
jgi:hypothetical protein